MRTILCLLVCIPLISGIAGGQAPQACLQDQYGNLYNFTIDKEHSYVYGTATPGPNQCKSGPWDITGSFGTAPSGIGFEITAANPDPTNGCVPIYTLKGIYPNFQWFYNFGISNPPQVATWVACGTAVSGKATGKGNLK